MPGWFLIDRQSRRNYDSLGSDAEALDERIAVRYAERMTQLVTRVDEDLVSLVDELVAEGVVESRSDAVRQGLAVLIDQHQRSRTAEAIILGYEQHPQAGNEIGWSDKATAAMIKSEPW